jgi:Tfp pilus assembly protein PilX
MDQEEQAGRPVAQLTATDRRGAGPARQRGWIGIVIVLVVVLIVGLLGVTALKQYIAPVSRPGTAAQETGSAAEATPRDAIERARALEDSVRRQAVDMQKRIDAAESETAK